MNYVSHIFTLMFGLGVGVRMALPPETKQAPPIHVTESEIFAIHLNCITPEVKEFSPEYYECFHLGVWNAIERKAN